MEDAKLMKDFFVKLACLLEIDCTENKDISSLFYEKIQELKNENDMLNTSLDHCVDNFHVTDGEGKILRINRAFENRCKIKRKDVEGRTIYDMERLGVYKPSLSSIAIREKKQITYLQSTPTEEVITTATPVLDENENVTYVVCNSRGVNELQLLKKHFSNENKLKKNSKQTDVNLIGESTVMQNIKESAIQVAEADSSVLITGETGSGKSALAKFIHQNSDRNKMRFIEINCAAIPESLIESELFGYSAGAFTGAKEGGKHGLIELADNGTLFLDEIGDMPLYVQAKLLNVLQERVITRLGDDKPIPVNIRLITATNSDLVKMIDAGTFRSELYYRINVIPLYMTPLRGRKEDIPLLIEHFRKKYCYINKTNVTISDEAMEKMYNYNWPGNVRELENLIERLVVTDHKGIVIKSDLPEYITSQKGLSDDSIIIDIKDNISLEDAVNELEKKMVISAYDAHKSSYKVAEDLNISQSAAIRKIHKYVTDTGEDEPT